jgi:hypothetical protein
LLTGADEERPTHNFTPDEAELCKKCFGKYDINSDGTIDIFEVCEEMC